MTPEMVFECLVVSDDIQVLSLMSCGLDRLSIDVERCANPVKGMELLAKRDVDLVVCDCKGAPGETKLLNEALTSDRKRKPTVITIVDGPLLAFGAKSAGAHVVIRKPLTPESSAQGLKTAYSRMVREERRAARCAIMSRVLARNKQGELIPITITDISEHGIGLFSKRKIDVGELLSFELTLSNASLSITVQARLLWTRHNLAGADFQCMSEADRRFLYTWLEGRVRRKRLAKTGSIGKAATSIFCGEHY
jgi:DNA-binding NarL/FixJ family response regulator